MFTCFRIKQIIQIDGWAIFAPEYVIVCWWWFFVLILFFFVLAGMGKYAAALSCTQRSELNPYHEDKLATLHSCMITILPTQVKRTNKQSFMGYQACEALVISDIWEEQESRATAYGIKALNEPSLTHWLTQNIFKNNVKCETYICMEYKLQKMIVLNLLFLFCDVTKTNICLLGQPFNPAYLHWSHRECFSCFLNRAWCRAVYQKRVCLHISVLKTK